MNVLEPEHEGKSPGEAELIGRIPVRNVWLLMLYGSRLLRYLDAKGQKRGRGEPGRHPRPRGGDTDAGSLAAHEA